MAPRVPITRFGAPRLHRIIRPNPELSRSMSHTRRATVSAFPCHPPPGSLASWHAESDFVDSFAFQLPKTASGDARVLARIMWDRPPLVFRTLLWIRDMVMRCFGVKTSASMRSQTDGRDHIDFFPVVSESAGEVVVGEDDIHLDFRASMLVVETGGDRLFVTTTVVRRHNILGYLYLWAIMPFHRGLVLHSLRRLQSRLHG